MKSIWSDGKCASCAKPDFKQLQGQSKLKTSRKGKSKEVREFYGQLAFIHMRGASSAESGVAIPNVSAVNMAHILPKESFPDVATDRDNIIILTWEEHTRFDELLGRHDFDTISLEFPNSWPIMVERLKVLIPKLTEGKTLSHALENYINDN